MRVLPWPQAPSRSHSPRNASALERGELDGGAGDIRPCCMPLSGIPWLDAHILGSGSMPRCPSRSATSVLDTDLPDSLGSSASIHRSVPDEAALHRGEMVPRMPHRDLQ